MKVYALKLVVPELHLTTLKETLADFISEGNWWSRLEGKEFIKVARNFITTLDAQCEQQRYQQDTIDILLEVYEQLLKTEDVTEDVADDVDADLSAEKVEALGQ